MSTTEFSHPGKASLGLAMTRSMRVTADLVRRWFESNPGAPSRCAATRTQGVLVIFANGDLADRIEGELLRSGLLKYVQTDAKVRPRP